MLSKLKEFIDFSDIINIVGFLNVMIITGILVESIFVHNCNKKGESLYLLSMYVKSP